MEPPLEIPALVASHAGVWRASSTGEVAALSRGEAMRALADTPHLLLYAPALAARIGLPEASGFDLLELWAFLHPAEFLVPSTKGLASALSLPAPARGAAEAPFLQQAAARLLASIADPGWTAAEGASESLARLARQRWAWAAEVAARLSTRPPRPAQPTQTQRGQSLFDSLPEWQEPAPRQPPAVRPLADADVQQALSRLAGPERPPRPQQRAYARAATHAFQPRESADGPNLVVAEAGTGTGKTLGYLAPASLYAAETGGQVWMSTYTRALQRQLKAETSRSLPDWVESRRVVVRKGRENYLCLLNLEDALQGAFRGRAAIFAELVARWARYTADGDMVGGDLPGWLPGLFGRGAALAALTDRRGECIHAACPHYHRCFIERSLRDGATADLVIANHALVLANAARPRAEGPGLARIVFDEGHHLEQAADSAFSLLLSGSEAIELRRWLLGPDRRRPGRRRGLAARLLDVTSYDERGSEALDRLLEEARATLPVSDWLLRLQAGEASGPIERLLQEVRAQVEAQASDGERGFTLESAIVELAPALVDAVEDGAAAIDRLGHAMRALRARLADIGAEQPPWLDQPGIARLSSAADGLQQRIILLAAWQRLLARVVGEPEDGFIDWFTLVRHEGRELDCGIERHFLDPMQPLAESVLQPAHGVLVTSATLGDPAEEAAGARHLATTPHLFRMDSPFDYGQQARIYIATDINRRDLASLAHAYAALIEAAGGGTLGLFTAISRLRAVHARIADRLARSGLPLLAQHVDAVDTGTLVDLFRADPRASLLGTDALRDGVDVPGDSLRLLVFEGVPWSRPTILHAARRSAGGGAAYEDRLVRRRLAQAFGRLIRSTEDRGVFVLLGPSVPSRLLDAFPAAAPVERLPLEEVAAAVASFLGDCNGASPFLEAGAGKGNLPLP